MRRIVAAAAMAGFSLVAAACGGADEDLAATDGGAEVANMLDPSALTGTVTAINGESVDLSTYANKDLVVWFWAPW